MTPNEEQSEFSIPYLQIIILLLQISIELIHPHCKRTSTEPRPSDLHTTTCTLAIHRVITQKYVKAKRIFLQSFNYQGSANKKKRTKPFKEKEREI